MKTYTTIRDISNALAQSLGLQLDETEAAIRIHGALFSGYGLIPNREIAALSRAVFETVTGAEYPESWATEDRERIAAEDDDTTWIRNDDERADASEAAYNAALERGGSQDECHAAAETAYDECALRQRQDAEAEYQDNHR